MPTQTNITVKKADGTTDVVYTAICPAAGDGSAAIFKNKTVGTTVGQQPELRMTATAKGNAAEPARSVKTTYKYPRSVSNVTTGEIILKPGLMIKFEAIQSQVMPAAELAEGVHQGCNLVASALFKQCVIDGFAAS